MTQNTNKLLMLLEETAMEYEKMIEIMSKRLNEIKAVIGHNNTTNSFSNEISKKHNNVEEEIKKIRENVMSQVKSTTQNLGNFGTFGAGGMPNMSRMPNMPLDMASFDSDKKENKDG